LEILQPNNLIKEKTKMDKFREKKTLFMKCDATFQLGEPNIF
jgi:hypothetical protein